MAASSVTVVLVHSPFLGPASVRPLAEALIARGVPAEAPDVRPGYLAPPVHQRLIGGFIDAIDALELPGKLVLAGHSGAGPLLPAYADALEEAVTGLVYLDAGLPTPGQSWRDAAPPELYRQLRDQSRDGLLPPWRHWFDEQTLPALIPDATLRAEVADEAIKVPLAFLKEARPDLEWPGPSGYLLLSEAYQEEAKAARGRGWPVRELALHHLAPASDPEPVAAALTDLLAELSA